MNNNSKALIATYKRSLPELEALFSDLEKQAAEGKERIQKLYAALSLKADLLEPETEARRTGQVKADKFNAKEALLESGFFTSDEAEGQQAKGLYTYIEEYQGLLSAAELIRVIERVLRLQEAGKVREKVPYLKKSIKNFINERGEAL